jgi:hypothetical protein
LDFGASFAKDREATRKATLSTMFVVFFISFWTSLIVAIFKGSLILQTLADRGDAVNGNLTAFLHLQIHFVIQKGLE